MLHRLFEQLETILTLATMALVFGLIKLLVSASVLTWRANLLYVLVSVIVGTLAGSVALELGASDAVALSVTSVLSLTSRDLLHALVDQKIMSSLGKRAAENIVDKITK